MRIILLLALPILFGGCATAGAERLPVCDGLARRPANPHGSVLLPVPAVDPAVDPIPEPRAPRVDGSTGGCA